MLIGCLRVILAAVVIAAVAASAALGLTVFDFEDGTLQGWTIVSGEAGKLPTGPETARRNVQFNQQGDYFIGLYESPLNDTAQIVLQSPTFRISADTISLLVGGGSDRANCYVALYQARDNTEIFRETGMNTEMMVRRYWDVSKLKSREVYIKIVDSHTGGWGHINVDDIRELSPAEERDYRAWLAARERQYEEWLASIYSPAAKIVYTGPALQDVAMPLGGIGSGHVSICGGRCGPSMANVQQVQRCLHCTRQFLCDLGEVGLWQTGGQAAAANASVGPAGRCERGVCRGVSDSRTHL